jgi:hypothetical protein
MVLARRLGRLDVLPVGRAARELAVRIHPGFDRVELRFERAFRRLLHVQIEGRVDAQPAFVQVAAELRVQLHPQPLDEVRGDIAVVGAVRREDEWVGAPQLALFRREEALIAHQAQHDIAPPHGAVGMGARVIERRELRQRRQHRGLGDVELVGRLAEVDLRRRGHAVRPGAQVDLVQVQLQDRVLGKIVLDLDRDPRLLEFAGQRLLAADVVGEDVARELHRDGREALREPEREQVVLDRTQDAQVIDPVVVVEALVLGGDEGLAHRHGNLAQGDHGAALGTELADQATVRGVHLRGLHLMIRVGDEARDARAVLARAHPGPRAVGEAEHVGAAEHRRRDHAGAGLWVVPPGRAPRHGGGGDGRRNGSHRVTT